MLPPMSHNLPTKAQDSTPAPQPDKSISRVGMLASLLGDQVKDVQGNAKWDTLKFIYRHRVEICALLLLGWGAITTFIAALIQKFRGIPVDWLIIGLLGLASIVPLCIVTILFWWTLKRLSPYPADVALPQATQNGVVTGALGEGQPADEKPPKNGPQISGEIRNAYYDTTHNPAVGVTVVKVIMNVFIENDGPALPFVIFDLRSYSAATGSWVKRTALPRIE
jgi:hypothetical protein